MSFVRSSIVIQLAKIEQHNPTIVVLYNSIFKSKLAIQSRLVFQSILFLITLFINFNFMEKLCQST